MSDLLGILGLAGSGLNGALGYDHGNVYSQQQANNQFAAYHNSQNQLQASTLYSQGMANAQAYRDLGAMMQYQQRQASAFNTPMYRSPSPPKPSYAAKVEPSEDDKKDAYVEGLMEAVAKQGEEIRGAFWAAIDGMSS